MFTCPSIKSDFSQKQFQKKVLQEINTYFVLLDESPKCVFALLTIFFPLVTKHILLPDMHFTKSYKPTVPSKFKERELTRIDHMRSKEESTIPAVVSSCKLESNIACITKSLQVHANKFFISNPEFLFH